MFEIDRLSGGFEALNFDFEEPVVRPKRFIKLAIQLHRGGLSLSNTVSIRDTLGVIRSRSAVHNGAQKANLEPRNGRDPDKIAVDETIVKGNGERFWLYAAVDPEINVILPV